MNDLSDALHALRRRWITIVALTLAGLALAGAALAVQPVRFSSTASLYVAATGATNLSDVSAGNTTAQQITTSMAQVATTPRVLDAVRKALKLTESAGELASGVSVDVPSGTAVMNITVTNGAPVVAARIANAIAAELGTQLAELNPNVGNAASVLRTYPLRQAQPGTAPVSPKVGSTLAIGALGGFAAGVVIVLTARLLTRRVRSAEDLSAAVGAPVVGVIPEMPSEAGGRVALINGEEPFGERIRELRANVRFLPRRGHGQVMLITSPDTGDGKSTIAVNLAYALSIAGQRVLLMDADLRRPSQHRFWEVDPAVGLSTVLIGDRQLEDAVIDLGADGLHLLPAGSVPPNPGELCASPAMRELVERARGEYDVVVIDSPPVQHVADALDVASEVDGVLVIARSGGTLLRDAASAAAKLRSNGAQIFGFVVSRTDQRDVGGYRYTSGSEHSADVRELPVPAKHRSTHTASIPTSTGA